MERGRNGNLYISEQLGEEDVKESRETRMEGLGRT